MLRRILGPKRDEVMGEWTKLCNEELRDLYSSPSIIRKLKSRRMRWAGYVARMGRRGKHIGYWWEIDHQEDKRRWVDNIKMDLGEIGCHCVDWIDLAQNRDKWRALVNAVMNLRVSLNAGKLSSGYISSGLSSSAQLHRVRQLISSIIDHIWTYRGTVQSLSAVLALISEPFEDVGYNETDDSCTGEP
jgi:hypothetical protein